MQSSKIKSGRNPRVWKPHRPASVPRKPRTLDNASTEQLRMIRYVGTEKPDREPPSHSWPGTKIPDVSTGHGIADAAEGTGSGAPDFSTGHGIAGA
eukprot:1276557-Rhodomonas_salina.2